MNYRKEILNAFVITLTADEAGVVYVPDDDAIVVHRDRYGQRMVFSLASEAPRGRGFRVFTGPGAFDYADLCRTLPDADRLLAIREAYACLDRGLMIPYETQRRIRGIPGWVKRFPTVAARRLGDQHGIRALRRKAEAVT